MEELKAEGYIISVTYDANGGNFGEPGQKLLVDLFNPDNYEKEADGTVHIYLQNLSSRRNEQGTKFENVAVRNTYGFWGWYRNKDLYVDADGNIWDEDGNILDRVESVGSDGEVTYTYYIRGTDTESTPLYVYTDEWDFENDYIVYSGEDELDITLYAAWIPYFVFDFYYIDENGNEVNFGQTSFDYVSSTEENMKGYVFLPEYPDEGGKMVYTYSPSSGYTYTFPSLSGYTFDAAYYYNEKGEKTYIDGHLGHTGYVDENTTLSVNSVMKIYVEFLEGEVYEIKTAEQFTNTDYVTTDLIYKICADINFNCDTEGNALDSSKPAYAWPTRLDVNEFTGRIYTDGGTYTLSNIYVRHSNATTTMGGLFGCLGADSVIENIVFESVTFDFYSLNRSTTYGNYALFAGDIKEGATIDNVTLTGSLTFRLGALNTDNETNSLNIVSNAVGWEEMDGFSFKPASVDVVVYSSTRSPTAYYYNIDVFAVEVDVTTWDIEYRLYSANTDEYTDINGTTQKYTETSYIAFSWKETETV
ncbi:MAG: DUF3659 domain-containing protein [Bacteroidales bacterium]|nr:DUF3659 domain-containing protein [Bacteroidales bacterium]